MIQSNYKVLKDKKIAEILNGDIAVGYAQLNTEKKNLSMPYLTKSRICEIANKFGIKLDTDLYRWQLMYSLIDKGIKENNIESIINFLFSKSSFSNSLNVSSEEELNFLHDQITHKALDIINRLVEFSNVKLILNDNVVCIISINNFQPYSSHISEMKETYISDLYRKLIMKIEKNDFDSAITESRTLLEEVMIKLLEDKGEKDKNKGNIRKLYAQVKELYSMSMSNDLDKRIKMLLSGLEKIVISISEMRNNYSDSHGVGCSRIKVKRHHAILIVNSALTMSEFLLSVGKLENRNG